MFKSLKDILKSHFDFDYAPNTLLADSAAAITNGFTLGFGYPALWRIICWAHALRKFGSIYSKSITTPQHKIKAREDLLLLQHQNQ